MLTSDKVWSHSYTTRPWCRYWCLLLGARRSAMAARYAWLHSRLQAGVMYAREVWIALVVHCTGARATQLQVLEV
jgi:hypothetical protein